MTQATQRFMLPAGLSFPASVQEITEQFDRRLRQGKLSNYRPIPTGFPDLDTVLGGGLHAEDLILVGGGQGTGKTTWILQAARNIARDGVLAIVVCFEHSELYLFQRLLALESYDPAGGKEAGITRDVLRDRILEMAEAGQGHTRLDEVLQSIPGAGSVLGRMGAYWEHLRLVRGSSRRTSVEVIETYLKKARAEGCEQVVVLVDYLQKVHYQPPVGAPWPDPLQRIGIVMEGLKDVALDHGVPVVAVAAADDEGLRHGHISLADLWGPSLVQYECDVGIILNPGKRVDDRRGIKNVHFSVEKNRSGPDGVAITYPLHGRYFHFDAQGTDRTANGRRLDRQGQSVQSGVG